MKKNFTGACTGMLIIALIVSFVSCEKFTDVIGHPSGNANLKLCNIQKITTYNNNDSLVFEFSYNQKGNPTQLTTNKTQQGLYNLQFRYNQQHRLKDYYAEPLPGQPIDFNYLHKFTYDNNNRIIIDSNYMGGTFAAVDNGTQTPVQIVHFEYDNQGRIKTAKEISYPGSSAESEYINTYSYDANGNLENQGVSYDDKINWARTNPIWMFLRRDYSLNNPFNAVVYNQYKLPVQLNEPQSPYSIFVGPVYYGNSIIQYQCGGNGSQN